MPDAFLPEMRDGRVEKTVRYVKDISKGENDIVEVASTLPEIGLMFRLKEAMVAGHNSSPASFPQYNLHFSLNKDEEIAVESWIAGDSHGYRGTLSETFRRQVSETVMQTVNRYFQDASEQNCFTSPFLAATAYRLSDGSHAFVGPPVLMTPSSKAPAVRINSYSVADGELTTNVSIINRPCRLQTMPVYLDERLLSEKSVVAVEILVTRQSPMYNPDGKSLGIRNYAPGGFRHTDREKPLLEARCRGWDIEGYSEERIGNFVTEQHEFFVAASYTVEDISDMFGKGVFAEVRIDHLCLAELYGKEGIRPDYSGMRGMRGAAYRFNDRISVCSPAITLPDPFPLSVAEAYTEADGGSKVSYKVFCEVLKTKQLSVFRDDTDVDSVVELKGRFPRYLFYPDTDAKEIVIEGNGRHYRLHLTPSEALDGSFYFRGFGDEMPEEITYSYNAPEHDAVWRDINRLYTSDNGNSHLFPWRNITEFGSVVTGLAFSMRAVSGGQMGEFPLYCFTGSGVWLLRGSSGGGYAAVQMISRDRIENPLCAVSTETGAAYISERGLILLEGASARMILPGSRLAKGTVLSYDRGKHLIIAKTDDNRALCYYMESGIWVEMATGEGKDGISEMRTLPVSLGKPEASKKVRELEIMFAGEVSECELLAEGSDDMRVWHKVAIATCRRAGGIRCASFRFWRITVKWRGDGVPAGIALAYS